MVEPVTIVLGAGALALNAYGAFQYYKSRELLREKQLARQEKESATRASAIKNAIAAGEMGLPAAQEIQATLPAAKGQGKGVDPGLLEAIDSAIIAPKNGEQSVPFEEKPLFPGNPVNIPGDAFEKAFKELSDDWDKKVAQAEAEEKAEAKQAGKAASEEEIAESELFRENDDGAEQEELEEDGDAEGNNDAEGDQGQGEEELKTAHKELILRELAPYQKTISELSKKVEKLESALEKSAKPSGRALAKRK